MRDLEIFNEISEAEIDCLEAAEFTLGRKIVAKVVEPS
jgi:hypothetical protein